MMLKPVVTDLATYASAQTADKCLTCLLPPEVRAQVDEALVARRVATATILRWLRIEMHYKLSETALRRHRDNHLENTQ